MTNDPRQEVHQGTPVDSVPYAARDTSPPLSAPYTPDDSSMSSGVMAYKPLDIEIDDRPWLQQEGEPSLWYGRFLAYMHLGTRRTLAKAFRRETGHEDGRATTQWHRMSYDWSWKERAQAWDAQQEEMVQAIDHAEMIAARSLRRGILSSLGTKFEVAVESLDTDSISWTAAAKMCEVIIAALRDEYGDFAATAEGGLTIKLVKDLTTMFVSTFSEVNELGGGDSGVRREAFAAKLREIKSRVA